MHVALVASASILDNTLWQLNKAKLALQKLVHHNDIIINATQHCLDEAERSNQQLSNPDIANASAIKMQHGRLVALELHYDKVNKDGVTMVGDLLRDIDNIKLHQFSNIRSIKTGSPPP
jgi:hypothetical protein